MDEIMAPLPVEQFSTPDPTAVAGVATTVPDVRGLTGPQAVARLQSAGFSAFVAAQVNSSLPVGLTVGTDPGTGAAYYSGGSVRVFTSTGYVPPPPPAPAPQAQPDKKDPPKKPANNRPNNRNR
jgi:beta-lactam-binding protein with PASTA domain